MAGLYLADTAKCVPRRKQSVAKMSDILGNTTEANLPATRSACAFQRDRRGHGSRLVGATPPAGIARHSSPFPVGPVSPAQADLGMHYLQSGCPCRLAILLPIPTIFLTLPLVDRSFPASLNAHSPVLNHLNHRIWTSRRTFWTARPG